MISNEDKNSNLLDKVASKNLFLPGEVARLTTFNIWSPQWF